MSFKFWIKNGRPMAVEAISPAMLAEMEKVRQERNEIALALELLDGGMAVFCSGDGKSRIWFANGPFLKMTGIAADALSEADIVGILQDAVCADGVGLREAIRDAKKLHMEWRVEGTEETAPCWYRISLEPLPADGTGGRCYVCFLSDVTEAHVQKAQLLQSQKLEALGQLAGGVAHDFNNILSIVDGYARMALKHADEESPAFNYLERIKQASRRGASLTKQLLTFGRHKIVSENVMDIGALLSEQELLLRPLLNARINLSIRVDEGLFVECAADGIAQVFMNLVINARDAMPDGGVIGVDARIVEWDDLPLNLPVDRRKKDRFVCLSVEDNGTGMDHETQARMFDPFFTTKEQGKGSGLGLSMVYGIVRQFGGAIDVRSAPGAGTTMMIYFPLSDKNPESKAVIGPGENGGAARFQGYTVLVAEDEPDLLFVVGSMLEEMGMKVIRAKDGNDALVKQDDFSGDIDFLLTDVVMPELDGVRLAEMMEELRPEIKTVFMSGYPSGGTIACVQLPENAFLLAKPVEYEKLADVFAARLQDGVAGKAGDVHRWRPAGTA